MTGEDQILDAPEQQTGGGQDPNDPTFKLYTNLNKSQLYTKSYDEFKNQFSTPDQVDKLYSKLNEGQLYTKKKDEFYDQFFPSQKLHLGGGEVQQMPKVEFSQPTYKAAPATGVRQFYITPGQEHATVQKSDADKFLDQVKLQNQGETAHQNLTTLLHNSNDVVEGMFAEQHVNKLKQLQNAAESGAPGALEQYQKEIGNIYLPGQNPQATEQKKKELLSNPETTRQFVQAYVNFHPSKAPQVKADQYALDASKRGADIDKVEHNIKNIKEGNLDYNIKTGQVEKKVDPVSSFINGWKYKSKLYDDFDFINSATDQELADKYEKRRNEYNPDEPMEKPSGTLGEITQMFGSQPTKAMIAEGILGSIPGLEETAPAAGAALSFGDYGRLGQASAYEQIYNEARNQGKSPLEATQLAKSESLKAGLIDAAQGAAMGGLAGKFGMKGIPKFSQGYTKAIGQFLEQTGGEASAMAALGGASQVAKNKLVQAAGIDRPTSQGVVDQVATNFMMTAGIKAAVTGGKFVGPIIHGLAKQDPEVVDNHIQQNVAEGEITSEQGQQLQQQTSEVRGLDKLIPADVSDESRQKIIDLIKERDNLEHVTKKALHPAFTPKINEQIKAIDAKILELSNDTVKPEDVNRGTSTENIENQNNTDNATTIRSDSGQTGLGGEAAGGGQNIGGENLQQPTGQEPLTPGTQQQTGSNQENQSTGKEKVGGPPIDMKDLPFIPSEGEASGITHKATGETRKEFGLGEPYQKTTKSDIELNNEADQQIRAGYNIENLMGRLEKGEIPTDVETTILKKYKASLEKTIEKDPSNENLAYLKRLVDATDVAGTLTGRSLRSRQGMELRDDSLSGFFVREMDANGVGELTEAQKTQVLKEHSDIQAANKALEDKVAQLQEENTKLKAGENVTKAKRAASGGRKNHADYVKERQDAVAAAREALKKLRTGESGLSAVPLLGVRELIAIAPHVKKAMASLVHEGIDKLEDVVNRLHEDFKDILDGISKKDIHNIIAGEFDEKKSSRNEIAAKLRDLKTQASLVNKLEQLQQGKEPLNEKKKIQRNQEIEKLRQQIKEHDLTKLSEYKANTKKQITALEKDLAEGNFLKEEEKPLPLKLDKEALDLKNKLIQLKQERELRLAKAQYDKQSKLKKFGQGAMEVVQVPRTIMASMDFSAPLRQGLVATAAHPSKAIPAAIEMFKQSVSQGKFDKWLYDLKQSPEYHVIEQSGLYVSDPTANVNLAAKEEQFMSHLAEKIPVIGRFVKGSERAYVAYLNKLRVDIFQQGVDNFMREGKTFENSPELYKGLASFVNNSTGRGGLGKLEAAGQVLNSAFFSPRLIASRINLLNPLYYVKLPKEVRIMALKDMAKTVAFGMSIMGLAKLAGAEVSSNPTNPDFGKIKVGNTRWDMWGGFQQYVRVFAQLVTGKQTSSVTGKQSSMDDEKSKKTRADLMVGFFRGKLAPVPGAVWDVLAKKTVTGQPFHVTSKSDLQNKAQDLFEPLIYQDIRDAWKEQGFKSIFTVGVPSAFGAGVQTYGGKKNN